MQIGPIFINTDYVLDIIEQGFFATFAEVFTIGGYLFFVGVGIFFAIMYYQEYRENKATADWEWVVLAIDIPPLNVQTPKAIEQMFAHLAGAYDKPNIAGKFRGGYKQRSFSFEIISIEGYIQFLVRTEREFQDLVEASIYAQYPEAEITAVEDYVKDLPDTFPNETHDMWAADFGLAENEAYPLRSYHDFEHSISKDTVLKDPMGALLESFSRIGSGEQMWLQILVEPIGNSWKEKAIDKIKDIIGEKKEQKDTAIQKALDLPMKTVASFADSLYTVTPEGDSKKSDSGEKNELRYLTPGQTKIVEAMEQKISMIGMKTKIRGIYIARKEVFKPSRGVQALIGAMNQFNSPTANSLIPTDGVSASYFFKESKIKRKKNLYMEAYKKRKMNVGGNAFVLNVEELATIWHFPLSHVKTPQLQKVETKQSEPPIGLPIELLGGTPLVPDPETVQKKIDQQGTPLSGPKNEDTQTDDFGYSDTMDFG